MARCSSHRQVCQRCRAAAGGTAERHLHRRDRLHPHRAQERWCGAGASLAAAALVELWQAPLQAGHDAVADVQRVGTLHECGGCVLAGLATRMPSMRRVCKQKNGRRNHAGHACRRARGEPPAQDRAARADRGLRPRGRGPPRAARWRDQPARGARRGRAVRCCMFGCAVLCVDSHSSKKFRECGPSPRTACCITNWSEELDKAARRAARLLAAGSA
jgi:hypothetical protein